MAIRVHQREIVEVAYPMPDGSTLVHPALMSKESYFVTHIIAPFTAEQVMNRYNNFIKSAYFEPLIDHIISNVIGV